MSANYKIYSRISSTNSGSSITGDFYNIYRNLSIEECLSHVFTDDYIILFLWQSHRSVVIGKNQNPWNECQVHKLAENKIELARRISGGGTVFHDFGNLNFSYIVSKKNYDLIRQQRVIIDALKSLGITAGLNKRNDLLLKEKKISGNAFYHTKNFSLHHGTLLINSDLALIKKILQPCLQVSKIRGVKSVRSEVTNLDSVKKNITVQTVTDAIIKSFKKTYEIETSIKDPINDIGHPLYQKIFDRQKSWDWIYARTPAFEISLNHVMNQKNREKENIFNIQNGKIKNIFDKKPEYHILLKQYFKPYFIKYSDNLPLVSQ